ncbi:zinc finger protein 583-like [Elysia marginata]|uniref:Zinc finger protein 583-like n=1 Tax=Elysia marginata TaxID=1093978 RepID=A0AAV4HB16_9GAST|nr:zinc finger protein 583-like [Elysia marginata]
MPPQNLSTPTSQEKEHPQDHHHLLQHHQIQQLQQQQQQHMSQSLVEQPHSISGGAGGGAMSDQGHGSSHAALEHAHSMAEHAAHSMLDLSETGNSLEHLAGGGAGGSAGGGGHSSGHGGGHTPQSLADLAHRRQDQGLDSGSRRESIGLSNDGGGGAGSGGGGGSLTPTLHQMNQHGDGRGDLPGLASGGTSGSSNGSGGGGSLLSRPMSGLGGVTERQSMSQPMRNLTPVGGVDGRGDGGRISVGLTGSGVHSLQDQAGNNGNSGGQSSLNFSPDSQHHHHHHMPPQQRIPIIPKRGRPPGSGSSQHSLAGLHLHRGHLSSSSSLHGHHHHSSHNQHSNQGGLHMRGLSDHQHHNSHHGSNLSGDSSSHNGRAGGGIYGLDSSSGHQLNSRPGSVLMSEPSDSRDLGGRSNYSTSSSSGERNQSTSSSHSTSLIEETIAAVASNLHRSSPNGGIMPGPLPPNSHPSNSLMGGLGGLLPPRSNSTLGPGGAGDDSLADLVGRGHSHGIPMLSERASQSLSGLIDDGDGSGHNHQSHHHSLHHQGHPSSSGGGGREIEKTHPCLTCLKMFRSKQQLAQHSLVHTGIRKHICTFCDRAFKQLSHLQQHVRIHTGERKYMCKFCDRGFKQLSHLQKHISVHTEVDQATLQQLAPTKGKRGRKPKKTQTMSYAPFQSQP